MRRALEWTLRGAPFALALLLSRIPRDDGAPFSRVTTESYVVVSGLSADR